MPILGSRLKTGLLTPSMVSELIEEWKEEPLDYEDISHDNILLIVMRAISEGRCSDPELCAYIAMTTYDVGFERHHQWFQR